MRDDNKASGSSKIENLYKTRRHFDLLDVRTEICLEYRRNCVPGIPQNRPTNPRVAGTNVNSWNLCVAFQIVYARTFAGGTDNKARNAGFGTGMNKHESLNGLKLRPPELTH